MNPRILVWPADTQGCGHYRQLFPAWTLAQQGGDVRIDLKGPTIVWDRPWTGATPHPDVRVVGLQDPPDADIVVLQRCTRRWWADIIPHLQAAGIRVVVDIDDLLDGIRKDHASRPEFEQAHNSHRWADLACRLADQVTVTTPALLDRYGHGHGTVVPNYVPAYYLTVRSDRQERTVGWAGTVGTHPGDLQTAGGTVAQIVGRDGWTCRIVGDGLGVAEALRIPDVAATGWLSFDEYIVALGELDLGVVPLADSAFNRAKSCLKAMEMASVAVPVVMSPTPDNLRLHHAGVGLVAESRGQWARHLGRLARSPEYRADLAAAGQAAVGDRFTYERNADRWWEAWTKPLTGRRAA